MVWRRTLTSSLPSSKMRRHRECHSPATGAALHLLSISVDTQLFYDKLSLGGGSEGGRECWNMPWSLAERVCQRQKCPKPSRDQNMGLLDECLCWYQGEAKLLGFYILWISTARCNGPPFFIFISFFILLNCLSTSLLLPTKNFSSWKPVFWLSSYSLQSKWSRARTLLQQWTLFLSPAHVIVWSSRQVPQISVLIQLWWEPEGHKQECVDMVKIKLPLPLETAQSEAFVPGKVVRRSEGTF